MRANQLLAPLLVKKKDIPSREDKTVKIRLSNAVWFSILLGGDLAIVSVSGLGRCRNKTLSLPCRLSSIHAEGSSESVSQTILLELVSRCSVQLPRSPGYFVVAGIRPHGTGKDSI